MMTYQEQIKHPRWQKKRLEVLELHNFQCQVCRTKDDELHVHHPFYTRGAMIWEYDKTELECLCHRCHKDAHAIDEKIKKALATCKDKEKVLAFILSLSPQPQITQPKPEPPRPRALTLAEWDAKMEEQDSIALEEFSKELEPVYAEHPHLRPHPDDTDEDRAEKFFAKMKLWIG